MQKLSSSKNEAFKLRYGPWVVVAGASQGLGAAYAGQLAERGLNLVLIARNKDRLELLAAELTRLYSVEVRTLILDLSDPAAPEKIASATEDLDIGMLIYNAAYSAVGPFLNHSMAEHFKEIDTNIRTPLVLTYQFGSQLLERGRGGIILMSSLSAFQGSAYISNYSATKAYNLILAEGLWEEWRKKGVDVLVCVAGAIKTPNFNSSAPRQTGGFADSTQSPQEVASEGIAALGRRSFVIPGRGNRLASFVMRHLLPRRLAVQMMGRILRDMYVH